MVIGVLSDTHMPHRARALPEALWRAFEGVDMILHAGDLNTLDMLDPLRALAPVHAVIGNTDPWDTADMLPRAVRLELDGVIVGLTHGHDGHGRTTVERAVSHFPDAGVVVFGHSHVPLIEQRGAVLLVNPGSPTDRRSQPRFSCARLTLDGGVAAAELITWGP